MLLGSVSAIRGEAISRSRNWRSAGSRATSSRRQPGRSRRRDPIRSAAVCGAQVPLLGVFHLLAEVWPGLTVSISAAWADGRRLKVRRQ